jgi:signal transduction histidine kinase
MDSAIGLSTMLAIGPDNFRAMLDGFHQVDEHFRTASSERNLPVLIGLLAVWYNDFFEAFYTTKAEGMGMVLPICRSIVDAHGGRIWGSRPAGPGATVQLTLPMQGERA